MRLLAQSAFVDEDEYPCGLNVWGFFLISSEVWRCQLRIAYFVAAPELYRRDVAGSRSARAGSSRRGRRGSRRRTRLRSDEPPQLVQVHSGVGKPWAFGAFEQQRRQALELRGL